MKKNGPILVACLLVALLLATFAIPARAQVLPQQGATVLVQITPGLVYDLAGSGTAGVVFQLNDTLPSPSPSLQIQVTATAHIEVIAAEVEYTAGGVTRSITPVQLVVDGPYTVTIPANATSFSFNIQGSEGTTGFLWRSLFNIPYFQVNGVPFASYTTAVVVPTGNVISQEYEASSSLPVSYSTSTGSARGTQQFTLDSPATLVVMQPTLLLPASVAITSVSLVAIVLAAFNFFAQGRLVLRRLRNLVASVGRRTGLDRFRRIRPSFSVRRLFQPKKLLALFILCALVMVALGAVGGPDPSEKAYVVANPQDVGQIQNNLQSVAGDTHVVTPSQDFTDFGVMASVGQFQMLVVSNYPQQSIVRIDTYILAGAADVPVIVIDSSSNSTLATQLNSLYSNKIVHVQNALALSGSERQRLAILLANSERTNAFGLDLGVSGFKLLLAVEAVLSFVLVFVGWAFLGSLTSEVPDKDLLHLVEIVASCVFVFVFAEAVYVATSSLLAFPLSLHAVVSGAHDITAVGLLGLGGGSTPRLAAGFFGVMIGAVAPSRGLRVRWPDFALMLVVGLFLVANPFFLGQYVFEGLLLFLPFGNYAFGTAYSNLLSIKGFLYGVGSVLGAGVTGTYLMSAGKILFFAGTVPLAYLRKFSRTSAAFALLVVAFIVGDGGVRVGEMTPDKTYASIIPGIVAGLVFALLLLGLSLVENKLRGSWKLRRPE